MSQAHIAATQPTVEDLPTRAGDAKRVVVVGAGAAGLTAGYQLHQAGHEVVILEARKRPGGRLRTLRADFGDGLHAEAGAIFNPRQHEYLMKYVSLAGLERELVPVDAADLEGFCLLRGKRYLDGGPEPLLWTDDDSLVPTDWPGEFADEEKRLDIKSLWERYVERIEGGIGDPNDADWPPARLRQFDEKTVVELFESLGASSAAADLLRATHCADFGDNGHTVSSLYAFQQWFEARRVGENPSWSTIAGGNDRWIVRLGERMKEQIHYGSEVVAIDQTAEQVSVAVRRNGRQSTVSADHVICALPFSVLRAIAITGRLSAPKQRVISELQSTQLSHLYIQCEQRIWRREDGRGVIALSYTDGDLCTIIRDATFNQTDGPRGILDLYMVGPQAERMDALDEGDRLPLALRELEKTFPGISEVAEGSVYYSWNQDPFSRGDYVSYLPGQFTELWPHVATPEGRIHFAGDQTSVKAIWQDGAISSGHRAAREVAESEPKHDESPGS